MRTQRKGKAGEKELPNPSHSNTTAPPAEGENAPDPGGSDGQKPLRDQFPRLAEVDELVESPLNPREHFDPDSIKALADSIREQGLVQPLVVREAPAKILTPAGKPARYELIAGARRLRAIRLLGWKQVQCVLHTGVSDSDLVALAVVENLQRQDVQPIEEARGFQRLQELGWTQQQIAERTGTRQSHVSEMIGLLKLPAAVQQRIAIGELSAAHGAALVPNADFPDLCEALANIAVTKKVPSKDLSGAKALRDYEYDGLQGKMVELTGYDGAKWDYQSVCLKACPYNAVRSAGKRHWCLKPAHFRELQVKAKAEAAAAAAQKLAEAGGSGDTIPLVSLQSGSYVRFYDGQALPHGCTEACPCRRAAVDGRGKTVQICTDPDHWRALSDADKDARDQARQATADQVADVLEMAVSERIRPGDRLFDVAVVDRRLLGLVLGELITHSALDRRPTDWTDKGIATPPEREYQASRETWEWVSEGLTKDPAKFLAATVAVILDRAQTEMFRPYGRNAPPPGVSWLMKWGEEIPPELTVEPVFLPVEGPAEAPAQDSGPIAPPHVCAGCGLVNVPPGQTLCADCDPDWPVCMGCHAAPTRERVVSDYCEECEAERQAA